MNKENKNQITTADFQSKCPLLDYEFRVSGINRNKVIIKTPVQEAYTLQNKRLNGYPVANDAINKICRGCIYYDNLESGLVLHVSEGRCDPTAPLIQSDTEAVIIAHIGKTKAKNKSGFVYAIKKLFGATSD